MGVSMISRVRASMTLAFAMALPLVATGHPAEAADLPLVKLTQSNKVPACATPGRLMGFLKSRNSGYDSRFDEIAADYMRIGKQLKIRWDIAFFQMLVETGNLTFRRDVTANQNNFASIGAISSHNAGETFPDIATGVKAHLQHLLMYTGEHLDDAVAERTRNVQDWGVLTSWQKTISGPMAYGQLFNKWAPARSYLRDISSLAESFYGATCRGEDPYPEMMAQAEPEAPKAKATSKVAERSSDSDADAGSLQHAVSQTVSNSAEGEVTLPQFSGIQLAQRAVEAERKTAYARSSLGAEPEQTANVTVGEPSANTSPQVKIINSQTDEAVAPADSQPAATSSGDPVKPTMGRKTKVAALGSGTKSAILPTISAKQSSGGRSSCKVWTASYGGAHSVIIRARGEQQDNFTVLDVNEGSEQREADAYIAAYARGGQTVGTFTNPTQALDKAFELCPEG